ncbi:MAG: DNA polymerase [Thermotogota bacterium]
MSEDIYTIVRTARDYAEFIAALEAERIVAFDLETSNIAKAPDPANRILCAGFWMLERQRGYVVPIEKREGRAPIRFPVPVEKILADLRRIFADPARDWIAQNAKFDAGYFEFFDVKIAGKLWDTLQIERIADAEAQRGDLESLVKRYLQIENFKSPVSAFLAAWRTRYDTESFAAEMESLLWEVRKADGVFPEEIEYLEGLIAIASGKSEKVITEKALGALREKGARFTILEEIPPASKRGVTKFKIGVPASGVGGLRRSALHLLPDDTQRRLEADDSCYEVVPFEMLLRYCARDAHFTARVFLEQAEIMAEDSTLARLYDETWQVIHVLKRLEQQGIRFDNRRAVECLEAARKRRDSAEETLREIAYNVTGWSRDHCTVMDLGKEYVFPELLLKSGIVLTARTPTGKWKTDKDTRADLLHDIDGKLGASGTADEETACPICAAKIAKGATIYTIKRQGVSGACVVCAQDADPKTALQRLLIETINEYTYINDKITKSFEPLIERTLYYERIHANFNQGGARTGRLSSSDPNMQNIDKKEADLRSCFIADEGHVFLEFDMSQFEPRITAVSSGDPKMMQIFLDGKDFYGETAIEVEEVTTYTKAQRDLMKRVVLAKNYNAGEYRLAQQLRKPVDYVREKMKKYDLVYHVAAAHRFERIERMRETGFVDNHFGRKRDLRKILNAAKFSNDRELLKHCDNIAANNYIQMTAAEIALRQYIAIRRWLDETGYEDRGEIKFIVPVHDSVMFSVRADLVPVAIRAIVPIMEADYVEEWAGFPFTCEMKIGGDWANMLTIGSGKAALAFADEMDLAA